MRLNITKEGLEKAMNDRNSVLSAMGFDCDDSVIEVPKNTDKEITDSRYGRLVETEIEHDVFEVSYENQELYLNDLKNSPEKFVGYRK